MQTHKELKRFDWDDFILTAMMVVVIVLGVLVVVFGIVCIVCGIGGKYTPHFWFIGNQLYLM